MFYVYKHTCPNNKVYIGITSRLPQYRWGKNGSGYKKQEHFWRAIQKYGWDNIEHEILFENITFELACQKEIELIELYQSSNPCYGYNKSTGGECTAMGYQQSQKQKQDASNRFKGKNNPMYGRCGELNPMYGQTHTKEAKEKISKANKGRVGELSGFYGKHHKEESKYWKGKHLANETKEKLSKAHDGDKKPVGQYDKDTGELLCTYPSIMEASRQTGGSDSSIVRVCKGKQHTCLGYVWKYLN